MCGAYGAVEWARPRRLEIHYVDNCWVYVTLNRDDLEHFMHDVLGGGATPDAKVRAGCRYLLMAEEY
jgi:hypothetical protein